MGAMAFQITSLMIVYSTFIQAQIKENIKALRHWSLWGGFTGDRWIPRTKDQQHGKCFHLMTSSCVGEELNQNSSRGRQKTALHLHLHHKCPVTRKMFPFDDVIMAIMLGKVSGFVGKYSHSSLSNSLRPSDAIRGHTSGILLAIRHQAITWTNVDLISTGFWGIRLRPISQ